MATTPEEAVRRTLSEFCVHLDERRFTEWSELFAEDAVFQGSTTRPVILAHMQAGELATLPDLVRKHVTVNHLIDVDGETAHAVSDLLIVDRYHDDEPWNTRLGVYTDDLRLEGGRWLFTNRQVRWSANSPDD